MVLMVGGKAKEGGAPVTGANYIICIVSCLEIGSVPLPVRSEIVATTQQGLLSKQINALVMWEDDKWLFVRGVISKCSAFDAYGFNHPRNLSITPSLCSPLLGFSMPHKANFWLC